MENFWGAVIAALLTLILALLGLQWKDQREFNKQTSKDLKGKVDKTDCEKDREKCSRGPSWEHFRAHSHTSLPDHSKVIG